MTKLKAFATHIGISLIIFILLAAYIIYFWYPQPFFTSDGGWQGLRIIAAVDLVLGPVLTLIVFKPGKPRLKMDLTIIGLVQASALGWGIWVVHFERPIATVYTINYFSTVTANDLKSRDFSGEKLKPFGERTPVWIYSALPQKTDELQKLLLQSLQTGRGIQLYTEYFQPLDDSNKSVIAQRSLDLATWVKEKPEYKAEYERFINTHKDQIQNIIFVPWRARYDTTIIALSRDNLDYIETLKIRPPETKEEKLRYIE